MFVKGNSLGISANLAKNREKTASPPLKNSPEEDIVGLLLVVGPIFKNETNGLKCNV